MAAAAATNAQAATMDGATTVPAPVGMDHGRARTVQNEFQNMFVEFLTDFRDTDAEGMEQAVDGEEEDAFMFKYRRMVLEDLEFDRTGMLTVSFRDINNFSMQLETALRTQFYEVEPTLRAAVTQLVRRVRPDLIAEGPGEEQLEFGVRFVDLPECERLRDLKVDKIGHLTSFAGTVTRTSEVRPELFKGTFKCDSCFTVIDNVYQQFKYTMPVICSNTTCGNKNKFTLIKEKSTFVDWQRVKVQENTDEVPAGSLPRTMDVIMRGRGVETANPGDKMRFTGMLVVVPDVAALSSPGGIAIKSSKGDKTSAADGFTMKSSGARELTYKLMFISSSCEPPTVKTGAVNIRSDEELKSEEVLASYDASAAREVELMKADPQVYQKLTRSLCPSVYGHDSIKQAVLLMLMGGVHKKTHEGINLRGDINVAIVGDPGCAKSQILKYVANFLPRAVYTSGKASTAAGLTASVVREPENNEFAIEAGALMLADNGICCIDEFDKMDVKDQVAIHEAMEQQTISITKAGIQATLNARASILAAANPLGGRYDKSKPLKYNVALPPAILSRFDLLHVMVDDTDEAADMRIARHIIGVHCHGFHAFDTVPYKTDAIQRYIRYARSIKPQLSHEAAEKLVRMYKELRSDDAAPGTQSAYRITVRQLEALVRLSEAMARVYCQDVIKPNHVEEAARLLKSSILKIEQSDIELEDIAYPQQQAEGLGDGLQPPAPAEATVAAAATGEDTEMADADGAAAAAEAAPAEGAQADGAVAGAAPEQDGEEAAAAQQAAAPKEKTKITAQKFNYMRTMLARKLTDVQERGAGQAEGMDEDEDGAGIRQQDLMQWYMDTQIKRKAVVGYDAAEQEMGLLFKVINKLILQNNTVAVLSKPERNPDEEEEAYEMRMQLDRVLSLHANYAPDV